MFTGSLFQINLRLFTIVLLSGFQTYQNLWNPLRQYLVNFMDVAGIVKATVYKTKPLLQVLGMANCRNIFYTTLV